MPGWFTGWLTGKTPDEPVSWARRRTGRDQDPWGRTVTTQPPASGPMTTEQAARLLTDAIAQVQRVIVGQEHMVEQLMVSLLAKGHTLLEGVPGVAKTLAVRSFATVVGGEFARIRHIPRGFLHLRPLSGWK